ncbi:MAG: 3-dehydroquinate synthase family protein [Candidatus Cloacimonadota bacterium]|nr:3-dehydroquinate synthase family protein [Candidatus Cloacimonadota bacterium]
MKFTLNNFISEIEIIEKFKGLESAKKVVIIDNNIYEIYKNKLNIYINDSPIFIFDAKENNKTIDEAKKIFSFFIENNVTRETVILGIGGGITTDIASFAASTFKRGCRLQLIPTTFLGMIDAAIGGKTAINFNGIKNAIGTFYPAEKVYIHPAFLETLQEKDRQSGWAECLKVSLIKDNGLYEILSDKKSVITPEILHKAIEIKMTLCENDLKDSGERRILNLGHTFAHLIESASGYTVTHGEAVAIGIRKAAEYSFKENMINKNKFNKIIELLDKYILPKTISNEIKNKIKKKGETLILQDKKAGDKVRLVLFQGFQDITIKKIDDHKKVIDFLI